ncbi:hypothetical protein L3X38_042660 [Prunus dulcis]|uniref:Uncharacterized protein n=1 Tax=Prunus dulcis TaxID=3755 RepID=A0AAD4UVD5_PRUDU|nr:hypothetical protein L3X38_042660 [Prunus dulcis]
MLGCNYKNSQVPNPEVTSRPRTWGTTVYTIVNRADPASKRLAPRQPRLLPYRRKTHFRSARHLPKLPAAKPNLQDTCRHHDDLHKVSHQPISPRASALFPAEDSVHLITKLDSILAGLF